MILHRLKPYALFVFATACAALLARDVHGFGIGQVMKAKSLPEATVAVIDPETGTSGGTSGSDVKIAVGDIILFRFAYAPVPDKSNRSMQTYLTEYVPPNTEVVGVRFIDSEGRTILPRLPGLAVDGCSGGARCNTYDNLPCNDGADNCDFGAGSVAQVHADTGIFFTTDARLARDPADVFLSGSNGIEMTEEPSRLSDIDALLDIASPFYAHNAWDYTQALAFGVSGARSGSGGDGNPPYLYGSPVAGPQTFYSFEATENGAFGIEFNDEVGPWQRIDSPGSKIGFGDPNLGDSGIVTRNVRDPVGLERGFDVTPATPIVGAEAVRFAAGESRTGVPDFVEVALRVTGVPLDPLFGGTGDSVDCGEVIGSGLSSRLSGFGGSNQPQTGAETQWSYYIANPACVFLKLKFDLEADRDLAAGSVGYRMFAKNLSIEPQTGVVLRQSYDGTKLVFFSADIAPDGPAFTCPDDATKTCLTWTIGTMDPSDEVEVNTVFTTGGGGQISGVMEGRFTSDTLPTGFETRDVILIVPIARPSISVAPALDQTVTPATAGAVTNLAGTISNTGTNDFNYAAIQLGLPAGWTSGGSIDVGGTLFPCTSGCGGSNPAYDFSVSFGLADTRAITIPISVPGATAVDLYDVDIQLWGSQTGGGFGGTFETSFPAAATIAVGAVRTEKPVLDCPIGSTATEVTGTSEASADIRLLFNLIERGNGTADGAGDWLVDNFDAFGGMYGGLEVHATAQAPGELESERSDACEVTAMRECSDAIDNDGDGLIDFPADPGCDSPTDSSELDDIPECSDGVDNDGDSDIDFPDDLGCFGPDDPDEGDPACSDGIDNDGDGLIDFPADPGCTDANDIDELVRPQCSDGIDNDGDGDIDFPADAFCNSPFDDDEFDVSVPTGEIKARLLIVFDTSGSMNFNTCASEFTGGDGSTECPGSDVACVDCGATDCGNGLPDDSRMAKVKTGLNNVIAGFGEVEYGLMRFHQRGEQFDIPDDCPTQNASLQSGGWQGAVSVPGFTDPDDTCGGGFNAGDILVQFSHDNQLDLLAYMDGDSNYPGEPPPGMDQELRGTGTTPLGGALESALSYLDGVRAGDGVSDCRPYRVILVTDGAETCNGDPVAAATALEAAGFTTHVIGFATSDAGIVASLDAIAAAGGTTEAIIASDSTALSAAMADIISETILVERCNGLDDDCDILVDEDFPSLGLDCNNGEQGVCLLPGEFVCTADQLDVECNAPPGTSGTEECDGLDNDCDGLIDEGFPVTCVCVPTSEVCNGTDDDCDMITDEDTVADPLPGVGDDCGIDIGLCEFGAIECNAGVLECGGGVGPDVEVCDTFDNDCDTLVDEFVESCYEFPSGCDVGTGVCTGLCRTGLRGCDPGGGLGECIGDVGPVAELCNGIDDDCDGAIDETFNVGDACDNGLLGVCLVMGTFQCTADQLGTFCTAFPVSAGPEVCNGLDDDCDDAIDEDLGPPVGGECGGGTACTGGTLECIDGELSCEGAVGGTAETCNGIDDDCDSIIDEDVPGEGLECTDPGFEEIGDTGECDYGVTQCIGGSIICVGYDGPKPEVCNGLDDDCDGVGDDMPECPSDEDVCHEGSCVSPCELGEFPCPFGFLCRDIGVGEFCVPDPCVGVSCDVGELCNSDTGACEDPCDLINCPAGSTCFLGSCFDCFDPGYECAEDELCIANMGGVGECQDNPCFGVECEETEFCRDGECIATVCDPTCLEGQFCDEGTCVDDPCAEVNCPDPFICNPETGDCVNDPCEDVSCPPGRACNPSTGECENDPCIGVDCPDGFRCEVDFGGGAVCRPEPTNPGDPGEDIFAAGGGCACDVSQRGAPGTGSWILILLVALGIGRYRRTRGHARLKGSAKR
jgi:hypothetical protein